MIQILVSFKYLNMFFYALIVLKFIFDYIFSAFFLKHHYLAHIFSRLYEHLFLLFLYHSLNKISKKNEIQVWSLMPSIISF